MKRGRKSGQSLSADDRVTRSVASSSRNPNAGEIPRSSVHFSPRIEKLSFSRKSVHSCSKIKPSRLRVRLVTPNNCAINRVARLRCQRTLALFVSSARKLLKIFLCSFYTRRTPTRVFSPEAATDPLEPNSRYSSNHQSYLIVIALARRKYSKLLPMRSCNEILI